MLRTTLPQFGAAATKSYSVHCIERMAGIRFNRSPHGAHRSAPHNNLTLLLMRLLPVIAIALACCRPLWCFAEGNYAFVDDEGGVHLTNVPDDQRYLRLDPPAPAATRAGGTQPQGSEAVPRYAYRDVIESAAGRYGVEPALLHAVISVESGYNPKAVSKRGASGLMQLMPETAKRYGVTDLFNPAANVRAGAQYLADLLRMFDNDLQLALAAYNAGEAAVVKFGNRIPPYRETVQYVPKVVDFYRRFRSLFGQPPV
jgi:hypothetical protein